MINKQLQPLIDKLASPDTAVPRLTGNWLRAVRVGWWMLAVTAVLILLASLPGYALKLSGQLSHGSPETRTIGVVIFAVLSGVSSLAVALLSLGLAFVFFRRRFTEPAAAVMAFFLLIYGVALAGPLEALSAYWTGDVARAQTLQGLLLVTPMMALFVLFPNGRFVPAWTRWLLLLTIPWNITLFFLPGFGDDAFTNLPPVQMGLLLVWYASFLLTGLYAQVYRFRRVSTPAERQQTKWVVFGFALWLTYGAISAWPYFYLLDLPPGAPLPWWAAAAELGWFLSLAIIPVMLAIAVTRSRLWQIDIIINRTLVYGALTAVTAGLYLLVVASVGVVFQQSSHLANGILTAVLILFLFRPLRHRLQVGADRLVPVNNHPPPITKTTIEQTQMISHTVIFLWAVILLIALISLILVFLNREAPKPDRWGFSGFQSLVAALTAFTGILITYRYRRHPIGWILLAAGLFAGLTGLSEELAVYAVHTRPALLPTSLIIAGLFNWNWVLSYALIAIYLPLLFPNGRFLSPRWHIVAWLGGVWVALSAAWLILRPGPLPNNANINNPFGVEAWNETIITALDPRLVIPMVGAFLMLAAATSLIIRYRHSQDLVTKQQLKWLAYAAVILSFAGIVGQLSNPIANIALTIMVASMPLAMTVAILRYRLYDIDLLINRTLVYGVLTVLVVGLYVLVVGITGTLVRLQGNWTASLLATGLVAVLFQPLRERLQRGVNRLIYGERDDPVAVFSKLGERLATAVAPEEMLPILARTIARTLKLPYVAVTRQANGMPEIAAAYGKPAADLVHLPLTYHGQIIGELQVAPRQTGEPFNPAEMALLQNIARQAGTAVYAAQLTADLRRSRQRLVTAREEERRRLRRDLHDDLGPKLASLTLSLDAMGKLMARDPAAAAALLAELKEQVGTAVQDIRRLVYDLRPPTLDDLGLVAALRESAARYRPGGVRFMISAPESLPALPAAVEVATYRIAQEAMTNVVRHAQATTCRVTLALEPGMLCLTIQDDGCGLPANVQPGIGLRSMRERVAELDGRFTIESDPGGTVVKAMLPLRE